MRHSFFLLLLLIACSAEPSVPSGVLKPKKMEAVLYDVMRADEMVSILSLKDSTYRNNLSKRTSLYDTIFHLHQIDKTTFQKSMNFYEGRPDLLKPILDHLQKENDSLPAKKRSPQKNE